MRTRSAAIAAAPVLMLLAACSSHPPGLDGSSSQVNSHAPDGPVSQAALGRATNWPQYHANAERSGDVAGLPRAGRLSVAWSRGLGGAVYGQPLVIGRTVIAATETDVVYGLRRGTGEVLWHVTVGRPLPLGRQPCGNVNPLGITGTPIYDSQTRLVYLVAQSGRTGHLLVGLRPTDGRVEMRSNVPSPDRQPFYDQQRGALALAGGYIYVAFGGHFGDCGPYIGSVVGMPASGRGPIYSYRVPTAGRGGIWAAGGPVVSSTGLIYVSSGNGAAIQPPFDGSNSVIELTQKLRRIGVFAPANWGSLSAADLDVGSTSPALAGDRILQVGKSGVGWLLNATHLGGVGGQLAYRRLCTAFGAAAVSGTVVYVPCWQSGVMAVDTGHNRITLRWQSPVAAWGSPVVGGGAVWVAEPYDGTLYELAPGTGRIRYQLRIAGTLPDFVSPSLSGGLVLLGTNFGVTAVLGA